MSWHVSMICYVAIGMIFSEGQNMTNYLLDHLIQNSLAKIASMLMIDLVQNLSWSMSARSCYCSKLCWNVMVANSIQFLCQFNMIGFVNLFRNDNC